MRIPQYFAAHLQAIGITVFLTHKNTPDERDKGSPHRDKRTCFGERACFSERANCGERACPALGCAAAPNPGKLIHLNKRTD